MIMVNVSVSADQVRKRLGLTAEDIKDEDVMAFVTEAAAWLGDEIGRTLDYTSCTESEANAIRNLAAIYCYCHVSGGVAVGLTSASETCMFQREQQSKFNFSTSRLNVLLIVKQLLPLL